MSKEAKIGLFVVLSLVVIVSVVWIKVRNAPETPAETAGTNTQENSQTDVASASGANIPATSDRSNPFANTGRTSSTTPTTGRTTSTGYRSPGWTDSTSSTRTTPSTTTGTTRTGYDDTASRRETVSGLFESVMNDTTSSTTGSTHTDTWETREPPATSTETSTSRWTESGTMSTDSWLDDVVESRTTGRTGSVPTGSTWATSPTGTTTRTIGTTARTTTTLVEWPKEHSVQKGETLAAIALHYYGESKHWRTIAEANAAAVPNPDRVREGQKLTIPQLQTQPRTEPAVDAAVTPAPGVKYKVQKGDTLISIARTTYGRNGEWERIFNANKDKLSTPDRIVEGMVLYLPPKTNLN